MSLAVPTTVTPYRIYWTYAVTILAIHLLALLALWPYFFSWIGVAVMIIGIHVFGQGITIGYHRLLTHRSFRTPRWVEYIFATLGICCLEDTPVRWVTTHRVHHANSDVQSDPHSPLVDFLWSHVGWLIVHNRQTQTLDAFSKYSKDLLKDRYYMYLEKHYWAQVWIYLAHAAVFFLAGFLGMLLAGGTTAVATQMGWSLVVWGVLVRTVAVWHITWSVNSLSHLFGYRSYETGENSRNNWLVAFLTVGEGWHNNHHQFPTAASVQHRWWEIDISYYEIKLLEKLGLATDIVEPKLKSSRPAAA
jgi:stearoyl-CoA desaturase (delta-9 desaturase)